MIIDSHTHVWPDDLADKVLRGRRAGMSALADGTVGGLLRSMDSSGVDRSVCLGVAQSAEYVQRVNTFIGGLDRSRLIGFGTVHPGLSVEKNVESLRNNALLGIKVHPLYQGFGLDDPGFWDILEAMGSEFVVIAHVGDGEDQEANRRGEPAKLRMITDHFKDLPLIACHFGGYRRLDDAERHVVGSRAFLETAWPPSLDDLDQERIRNLIFRHGADRVIFGSDWPMTDPAREIAAVRALDLGPENEKAILGGNLARLLNLGEA